MRIDSSISTPATTYITTKKVEICMNFGWDEAVEKVHDEGMDVRDVATGVVRTLMGGNRSDD